ncbi:MAG TPA: flagellar biosynthesis protein FlhF [Lysobacter sp.]|nr:flagellar biosynthesis protein FlhF [Lysobacter sp.]
MRIKRFIATDMRSALGMVREEQGPDAVILSSRTTADGIEVVAATDYDEALVHQALRAAAPRLPSDATGAPAAADANASAVASQDAAPVTASTQTSATAPRDSFASRARAVFRIGDAPASTKSAKPLTEPTLAELTGGFPPAATAAPISTERSAPCAASPAPSRFESIMAALVEPAVGTSPTASEAVTGAQAPSWALPAQASPGVHALNEHAACASATAALAAPHMAASASAPSAPAAALQAGPAPAIPAPVVPAVTAPVAVAPAVTETQTGSAPPSPPEITPPLLQVVAEPDPGISAMREELTSMRRMIEREMGQFTTERLRGSPGRSAAYDMLLGYGCDESLAQSVVAKLNPALPPDQVRTPMLAELARMLTIMRSEPIDDGGVIALIGPTGAGKTTTVAKLAARFAARHRARDVAMVTTDSERVGAIEQLHAHGRRLGITVCEAHGAESLAQTLEQLQDYPLVLVDTAGYGARDRALLGQITWLRATRQLRSLLVLPANAHPHDLNELVRRYRMASPEGVVLTKTDETGRLGAALSVAVRNGLSLAYTAHGQQVPSDLEAADGSNLVSQLEKLRRAADNPFVTEDHHAIA